MPQAEGMPTMSAAVPIQDVEAFGVRESSAPKSVAPSSTIVSAARPVVSRAWMMRARLIERATKTRPASAPDAPAAAMKKLSHAKGEKVEGRE